MTSFSVAVISDSVSSSRSPSESTTTATSSSNSGSTITATVFKYAPNIPLGLSLQGSTISGGGGIRIAKISPVSLCGQTKLRPGMILQSINGKTFQTDYDAVQYVKQCTGKIVIQATATASRPGSGSSSTTAVASCNGNSATNNVTSASTTTSAIQSSFAKEEDPGIVMPDFDTPTIIQADLDQLNASFQHTVAEVQEMEQEPSRQQESRQHHEQHYIQGAHAEETQVTASPHNHATTATAKNKRRNRGKALLDKTSNHQISTVKIKEPSVAAIPQNNSTSCHDKGQWNQWQSIHHQNQPLQKQAQPQPKAQPKTQPKVASMRNVITEPNNLHQRNGSSAQANLERLQMEQQLVEQQFIGATISGDTTGSSYSNNSFSSSSGSPYGSTTTANTTSDHSNSNRNTTATTSSGLFLVTIRKETKRTKIGLVLQGK